ncbi:MAG: DUF456 domain-containing protein [bacterium]|nr:DUF456 domain-containing protein [bacterium]
MLQIFIAIITSLLIIAGLAGTVIPFLPGEPLIFLGSIVYGFGFGFDRVGRGIYVALAILSAFSLVVNYIATSVGAKKFGASKFGILGAIVGAFLGFLIGNITGLVIGPFLGAFIGELLRVRKIDKSVKAGFGAVIGFFAGALTRVLISLVMTGLIIYGILR